MCSVVLKNPHSSTKACLVPVETGPLRFRHSLGEHGILLHMERTPAFLRARRVGVKIFDLSTPPIQPLVGGVLQHHWESWKEAEMSSGPSLF